jgi:hypothetical protein
VCGVDRPPWQTIGPILNLKTALRGNNSGTGFHGTALFVNPEGTIHTKSPSPGYAHEVPIHRLSDRFWICFEKVVPLATILVQVLIEESSSLTIQCLIRTNSPSQIIGPRPPLQINIGPILNLKTGFEKLSSLTTILVQVFIDQSYSLTPQGPIRTKLQIIGPTGLLDRLLDRFWIWRQFWEGITVVYKTGIGCYRPKLFVNPSRAITHKVPIPDNRAYGPPGPILNLKTILKRQCNCLQTGTDCYRPKLFLNSSRTNTKKIPSSPDTVIGIPEPATVAPSRSKLTNWEFWEVCSLVYRWRGNLYDSFALTSNGCKGVGSTGPLDRLLDRFWIWKRLWEAAILVQGFIEQRYSLTPEGPIHTKAPSPDNRAYRPPWQTIRPILNLKTVLRRYCNWLQNWGSTWTKSPNRNTWTSDRRAIS